MDTRNTVTSPTPDGGLAVRMPLVGGELILTDTSEYEMAEEVVSNDAVDNRKVKETPVGKENAENDTG